MKQEDRQYQTKENGEWKDIAAHELKVDQTFRLVNKDGSIYNHPHFHCSEFTVTKAINNSSYRKYDTLEAIC